MYQNYIDYYIKYRGIYCKFICMEHNMVNMKKVRINFGPFQVLLNNINAKNIAKLGLAQSDNCFLFNDTKAERFGISKEVC